MRLHVSGPSGFMAYGDLWGYNLIVLIFYKSSLGFMGEPWVIEIPINPHNPHKSQDWIYKISIQSNYIPKLILSKYIPINPHKP